MPELKVIHKPLHYGGKEHAVGARFTATEVDARYLVKTMKAEAAPIVAPAGKVASTAPPAPVEEPQAELAVEAIEVVEPEAPPTGTYRTRRLKTED